MMKENPEQSHLHLPIGIEGPTQCLSHLRDEINVVHVPVLHSVRTIGIADRLIVDLSVVLLALAKTLADALMIGRYLN